MAKRERVNIREKILNTAVGLLGECGIRKLAQPLIAKTAGVPQGHMTYYFPKRSQLLIAVADRSFESVAELVLKKAQAARGKMRDALILVAPLIKNRSRSRMLIGLLVESDENPDLRAKLQDHLEFSRKLVASALKRELSDEEARVVQAAILGLGIQFYLDDSTGAEKSIDRALKLLSKTFGG